MEREKMKSLVMTVAAAACCMALAQGPEGAPEGSRSKGPQIGERPGRAPRHGGMTPGGNGMVGDPLLRAVMNQKIAESLGLTDEQKAKIKALSAGKKDNREMQKKVREATMKQLELMKAEQIDEAAVMAAIDEVFDIRKQMAKDQARRVIEVKSILTPEQIEKAHENMKMMLESRGDRGARRGGARGSRGKGPRGGAAPEGESKPAPAPNAE